ncbi:MAG: hypothetical protein CTY21_13295 [Methylomonas sp.]|nr:MAG: hypothetical protein CTY21_13295 [Methylomonas sp.]
MNTPRRLTDASNRPRWQWAYSAFGDLPAQSLPAAGLSTLSYALRYPGQVDDGNGLFYNFNRFYDPRVGRYTQADPTGLDGGWNRFGYSEANPLSFTDPEGLVSTAACANPVNAAACTAAGIISKPIRIPPPIIFPDDCNDKCKKAIIDASNAYWKLTTKRLPQYESGGTRGRDGNHAKSILELQERLKKAISRVRVHCITPPPQLPEWERAANQPLPT